MALFQQSVIKKYISGLYENKLQQGWNHYESYFKNNAQQQKITDSKEEQFQYPFLDNLFDKCLGYTIDGSEQNLFTEFKNVTDSKKADGAIKINDEVVAVIELKSTKTKDFNKIQEQAFGYKVSHPNCKYVVTSNFNKLRFYIENATAYEEFDLFNLTYERFKLLWLCLSFESVSSGIPLKIKSESTLNEENITKKLYKDYSLFRKEIFNDIVEKNQQYDKLTLFNKTQKLLDRFLFIFFAEDRRLLPVNSISKIIEKWEDDIAYGDEKSLYTSFKLYFNLLNKGRPASAKREEIFAYNGGLFAPDDTLDSISIDDKLLSKHTKKLSTYDFDSDVSVNILGHIFEHSLSEIEEIQNEITGVETDKTSSKRKKDGVFYTPSYITKYIVDNTVGKLCQEKKEELEINEEVYTQRKARSKKRIDNLDAYRNWLLGITICDPACGSGAFLVQALDFLIEEHKYIDELNAAYHGASIPFSDITSSILENNLYGVDINGESVEIAKLSLWLRTAQKGRKLTSLNSNLKCGNSLIDDPEVAGDKAFNWENEFPEVFANGGFDVVIGNPPYGAKISKNDSDFISKKYNALITGEIDTYIVFYFQSLNLLKNDALLGFITPDTWLTISRGEGLRKYLFENVQIFDLHDWYKPFKDAKDTRCHTIIFSKTQFSLYNFKVVVVDSNGKPLKLFKQKSELLENFSSWNLYTSPLEQKVFRKMQISSINLGNLYNLKYGLRTGNNKKYLTSNISNSENGLKIARGSNIEYYHFNWIPEYLTTQEGLPISYFEKNILNQHKIIIQYVRTNSTAVDSRWLEASIIEEPNFVPLNSTSFIYPKSKDFKLKYLLCVLSSNLMNFYYKGHYTDVNVKPLYLSKLPIKNINRKKQNNFIKEADFIISKSKDLNGAVYKFSSYLKSIFSFGNLSAKLKKFYDLEFLDFINELNKEIKKVGGIKLTKNDEINWMEVFETKKAEALSLKKEINKIDKEINQMVYELYGLTPEEIEIVENATK